MSSRPELKIDWATYEAARYAVEHWHYSKRMPVFKSVYLGVWEDGRFEGVIIFGNGVCNHLVGSYGLNPREGAELTRIALRKHVTPVSRMISIAIRMLKKQSPGLRLLVSFSDKNEGHHGGIYQASGWIYTGETAYKQEYLRRGMRVSDRVVSQLVKEKKLRRQDLAKAPTLCKHRYLYPLDEAMRQQIEPLRQPYPKHSKQAIASNQDDSGGAAPTGTLQDA